MTLRIGDILVEKQIISQQDLDLALKEHQNTKEFLGQTLVRLNMITEEKWLFHFETAAQIQMNDQVIFAPAIHRSFAAANVIQPSTTQ